MACSTTWIEFGRINYGGGEVMKQLIKNIEQWAEDRNLITGCTSADQAMKLFSEFGELADAVAKNDIDGVKDGVGDVFVVITILCKQRGGRITPTSVYDNDNNVKQNIIDLAGYICDIAEDSMVSFTSLKMAFSLLIDISEEYGLTLEQCVSHAYNEIKDRKGIMHNGTFIKESDDRYKELVK